MGEISILWDRWNRF